MPRFVYIGAPGRQSTEATVSIPTRAFTTRAQGFDVVPIDTPDSTPSALCQRGKTKLFVDDADAWALLQLRGAKTACHTGGGNTRLFQETGQS